jgi:tetratricopeptide (TPR) repeat protein
LRSRSTTGRRYWLTPGAPKTRSLCRGTGGYADALANRASILLELDRPWSALAAVDAALRLYDVDGCERELAVALRSRCTILRELGRPAEALSAIDRAVTISRALARVGPDAFLPDLAAALNNASNALADCGRLAEALAASREAVAIQRRRAHAPGLALALTNLARRLGALGRAAPGANAAAEALRLLVPLLSAGAPMRAELALRTAQEYALLCRRAAVEPDGALVVAVHRALTESGVLRPPADPTPA